METVHQGDVLFLEKNSLYVLVLSREFFNRSGLAVVCPIEQKASGDALHIAVETPVFRGIAMLEHLKSIDLQARYYRKVTEIHYEEIQNISDAVQGIFDYYPYSL